VNEKKKARVFLFTSFQGGVGKSSASLHFAQGLRKKTGSKVALIELNLFSPSYLIWHYDLMNSLKTNFLEFFMGDWANFAPSEIGERFNEVDGIFPIPFVEPVTRKHSFPGSPSTKGRFWPRLTV